ncbi:hypothetical protein RJ641_025202 [Dillenia turbinata]|uniref:Uncharacterized protein n=1 Tax=Dillenia turbinata TaxID=194707 RepID=A0AAN8ZSP5_9MAGN
MASSHAWLKMVDAVEVFILHLQLKAFIQREESSDDPLPDLKSSSMSKAGRAQTSDLSSATFGSEVPLGYGTPCRIAFSKGGIRDIYVIPVSRGISGKLLLVEKLPFRSQRGVVIAAAPLAGLRPIMDENHRTWLHLRIREFDPKFITSESKEYHSNSSSDDLEGRWTLGFSTAEACDAARSLILEETGKQRSSVESLLSPFLQGHIFQNSLSTDL